MFLLEDNDPFFSQVPADIARLLVAREASMPDDIRSLDYFMHHFLRDFPVISDVMHREVVTLIVGTNREDPLAPFVYYLFIGFRCQINRSLAHLTDAKFDIQFAEARRYRSRQQ